MKVGIVILNYKNFAETIDCLESVLKQKDVSLEIVVVDNCSGNNSVKELISWKANKGDIGRNICILEASKNVGFARGNNIGIRYLLKKNIDFIIVSNSDIAYSDDYTIKAIVDSYQSGIGVITPTIYNLNGLPEMRTQYKRKLFPIRVYRHLLRIQNYKKLQYNTSSAKNGNTVKSKYQALTDGVLKDYYSLTGCYFALTPDYLRVFPFLFPGTFLYGEEIATLLLTYKAKLLTSLVKTEPIIHKQAASTDKTLKDGTERKMEMMAQSAREIRKIVFMNNKTIVQKYNRGSYVGD